MLKPEYITKTAGKILRFFITFAKTMIVMKRLYLSILALLYALTPLYSQVNNFGVTDGGNVYWQKVYNIAISREDILNIIINDGNFVDINNGDVITFRVYRSKLDVNDYGYSRGNVPIYVTAYDISCFVTVQIKEGKYRVTVDNIVLVRNVTNGLGKEGEEEPIETWAIKKGQISNGFSKSPSEIYDAYFTNLFLFQKKSYLDDEW